ncbi:MAG: hypothetical protein ACE5IY_01635 [bacterium]
MRLRRAGLTAVLVVLMGAVNTPGLPSDKNLEQYGYYADALSFMHSDDSLSFVELFGLIPTHDLIFVKFSGGFSASYRLAVKVIDSSGIVVATQALVDSVKVRTFKDIDKPRPARLSRFSFVLDPGGYVAHFTLTDLETRKDLMFQKEIEVRDFTRSVLQMSDVQIAASISTSDARNAFVKNQRLIVPNVPRVVLNAIYVYTEIYHLPYEGSGEFEATYLIQTEAGKTVKSIAYRRPKPDSTVALSLRIPIMELDSGHYVLVLQVQDLDGAQTVEHSTTFRIVDAGHGVATR